MQDIFSGDKDSNWRFYWNYHSVIRFKKPELPWGEVLCRNYVRVEAQLLIVGVFVTSVSLVAYGFNGEVWVVNFVHNV